MEYLETLAIIHSHVKYRKISNKITIFSKKSLISTPKLCLQRKNQSPIARCSLKIPFLPRTEVDKEILTLSKEAEFTRVMINK